MVGVGVGVVGAAFSQGPSRQLGGGGRWGAGNDRGRTSVHGHRSQIPFYLSPQP